jgi:hypothetical protein
MSIEEKFYRIFIGKYELLESKVAEHRLNSDTDGLSLLEQKVSSGKLFSGIKYTCFAAALGFGTLSSYDIFTGKGYGLILHLESHISAMAGLLGTHFHYSNKLCKAIDNKLFRQEETDPALARKWSIYGNSAHFAATVALGSAFAPMAYVAMSKAPIISGVLLGVLGFCVYHNYIKGYKALYMAWSDYLIGARRHH